jgi:transcriptional regulator GlxA family with amidase domain
VKPIQIPPKGLVVRESSSQAVVAGEPLVLKSLEFIREHLHEGLHVDDVARAVSVSRRWLEQVFHKNLGRAPAAEIRRAQLENATRLLLETDWPLRVIARHCGLNSPERLSTLFRREMGTSPGRFREKKMFN